MCELKGLDPSYVLTSEEHESCQRRLVGGEGRPETQMPATGIGTPAPPHPKFETHPGLGLWVSLSHDRHTTAHTLLGNENKMRV